LVEQLLADEGETLTRTLIYKALAGDVRCLQLCLDRLLPRRNSRPVDFQLPAISNAHDVVAAMAAITTGISDGSLTAEEAGHLAHVLEGYAKAVTTYDLAVRLDSLESRMRKTP
jgi:hypothetical protein